MLLSYEMGVDFYSLVYSMQSDQSRAFSLNETRLFMVDVHADGRVVDSRFRGCGFDLHRRHCLVFLSKTLYPLRRTG